MAFSFGQSKTVRGYTMDEVRSALQKDIRRGEEKQAVFWAAEIARSGYTRYLWKTLMVIASEDVGLAEPDAFSRVWSLFSAWDYLDKQKNRTHPERLFWVQAVIMLARARKSRIVDDAYNWAWGTNEREFEIPDYALDPHTGRGRRMGRKMPDFWDTSFHLENEHPDLPNEYEQLAKEAPLGEFVKGGTEKPLENPQLTEKETNAIDGDDIRPGFPDDVMTLI